MPGWPGLALLLFLHLARQARALLGEGGDGGPHQAAGGQGARSCQAAPSAHLDVPLRPASLGQITCLPSQKCLPVHLT